MGIQKLKKILNIFHDFAFIRALLRGTAAGTEHKRVLHGLDCRHVVDIGANRGQFALIARRYFPDARIDSFEPLKEPANRFKKVFARDKNIHLHHLAVGTNEGQAQIHISSRDDSSSLLPITRVQTSLFPGTGERGVRTIRVAPLKAVLEERDILPPALLKLDVQGYELHALQGCESLLHCFAYVYAECSFMELYEGQALADEVIEHLRTRGYRLQGIYNMAYDRKGRVIQADFFFEKGVR